MQNAEKTFYKIFQEKIAKEDSDKNIYTQNLLYFHCFKDAWDS